MLYFRRVMDFLDLKWMQEINDRSLTDAVPVSRDKGDLHVHFSSA